MKRSLFAVALLLAACGADPPESGKVLDQTFTAAWVETGFISTCMAYGQYGCTAYVPMPYTTKHPDTWHLFLENCDRVKKNGEPKCFKGYRPVDRSTYERTLVGDHYGKASA